MKVELLAPGGSYESVIAAFNAGADAVYTGGELFGARAGADNLTTEQLVDVIRYAHLHDKKLYLTINTLLKNNEIKRQLFDYLKPLYEAGLDAVIVQDFGVIRFVHEFFPKIHIHASTQMTIFGTRTVEELRSLGVTRIVTPRELSLKEIENIYQDTKMEIESFVHGALCYCYSGQCMMSSFIGGRSGNRGRCAQPCRMEYDLIRDGKVINQKDEKYILSPKDICTISLLPEIIQSGVYSLKIEGRMKKMEYISGVVEIYRKYLDLYETSPETYRVSKEDLDKLASLFNRNGFNESYYKQHNGRNMMSLKKVDFRKENIEYTTYLKNTYAGKKLKKPLDLLVECKKGKPFTIKSQLYLKHLDEEREIVASGAVPEPAQKKPIDKETLKKQISKLGNTDFIVKNIEISMDDDIFLPISEIKEVRRTFIEMTEKVLLEQFERAEELHLPQTESLPKTNAKQRCGVTASVWNEKQFSTVVESTLVEDVVLELAQFSKKQIQNCIQKAKTKGKRIFLALPYVFRQKDEQYFAKEYSEVLRNVSGVLIRNIEEYFYIREFNCDLEIRFDYNVYRMNDYASAYMKELQVYNTIPVELNSKEIRQLHCENSEMILYGYIPLMISAGCGLKTLNQCDKKNQRYQLRDRKGNMFTVQCVCNYCYNLMLNCKALSLFKFAEEISSMNISSVRLSFTIENEREVREVLEKAQKALIHHQKILEDENTTRGHYTRGVL